jgi:hypothetical protein
MPGMFDDLDIAEASTMTGAVFQQAKKSGGEPQFLQIVAKDGSATPNKSKPKNQS